MFLWTVLCQTTRSISMFNQRATPLQHVKLANGGIVLATNPKDDDCIKSTLMQHSLSQPTLYANYLSSRWLSNDAKKKKGKKKGHLVQLLYSSLFLFYLSQQHVVRFERETLSWRDWRDRVGYRSRNCTFHVPNFLPLYFFTDASYGLPINTRWLGQWFETWYLVQTKYVAVPPKLSPWKLANS